MIHTEVDPVAMVQNGSMRFIAASLPVMGLACLLTNLAIAQRPTPPTRDPHAPGYPAATDLPDGAVPPRTPMATS